MICIWSGWSSNFGAILSRSVVMVASMEAWDCGADAAGGALDEEYLRAGRNALFATAVSPRMELKGPRTLAIVRSIISKDVV